MRIHRISSLSTALIIAGALAACSSGGGTGSSNGTVSLGLIDGPVSGVTSIWLDITEVDLKPVNGTELSFPLNPPVKKDLLSLTPDNSATLLDSVTVPAGQYEWVRLKVDNSNSYVMTDTGGQVPLSVPSGIVRLVSGFTITADKHASFDIDWNARKGLVDPVGQTGYKLQPALRMIDMQQFGTLQGTVQTATIQAQANNCNADDPTNQNFDVGNVVYIYSGQNVTPDDIGGSGANPVATADVKPDANGAYTYKTILSPGDYTVAFTCQAANDDPTTDQSNSPTGMPPIVTFLKPSNNMQTGNITINNGGTMTIDF